MNNHAFGLMMTAIREDKKIEAIKQFRFVIQDETNEHPDKHAHSLRFAKDFIEALMPYNAPKPEPVEELSPYRFAVVSREYEQQVDVITGLSYEEALAHANQVITQKTDNLCFCYVAEMKLSAKTKYTYEMKPYGI